MFSNTFCTLSFFVSNPHHYQLPLSQNLRNLRFWYLQLSICSDATVPKPWYLQLPLFLIIRYRYTQYLLFFKKVKDLGFYRQNIRTFRSFSIQTMDTRLPQGLCLIYDWHWDLMLFPAHEQVSRHFSSLSLSVKVKPKWEEWLSLEHKVTDSK